MRIWIDLANSPHVPFFRALIKEFVDRKHEVLVTARNFAETVALAKRAGLNAEVIGGHGGGRLSGKAGNLIQRALSLASWARNKKLDLAVSHNSYSQILAARALTLKSVTLMDYEHQPANHLAFRFASRIIVPQAFPEAGLTRYGAAPGKVRRYDGLKEDVYLAAFEPDDQFENELEKLGILPHHVLVIVRPPAREALYHRFENDLFDRLLDRLRHAPNTRVVILPRNESQRRAYSALAPANFVLPSEPLDGANLIAHSDLVISGGGTMNREAAALGIPAASIYAGAWAAIDEELVRQGRLRRIGSAEDVDKLKIAKTAPPQAKRAKNVASQVADLILD
jgi:uncharacterized protein